MKIFYFENKKGGISLGIDNSFNSVGRPVAGFSSIEVDLDSNQLELRGAEYLQEAVNDFKIKSGCDDCSDSLKEMGVK